MPSATQLLTKYLEKKAGFSSPHTSLGSKAIKVLGTLGGAAGGAYTASKFLPDYPLMLSSLGALLGAAGATAATRGENEELANKWPTLPDKLKKSLIQEAQKAYKAKSGATLDVAQSTIGDDMTTPPQAELVRTLLTGVGAAGGFLGGLYGSNKLIDSLGVQDQTAKTIAYAVPTVAATLLGGDLGRWSATVATKTDREKLEEAIMDLPHETKQRLYTEHSRTRH